MEAVWEYKRRARLRCVQGQESVLGTNSYCTVQMLMLSPCPGKSMWSHMIEQLVYLASLFGFMSSRHKLRIENRFNQKQEAMQRACANAWVAEIRRAGGWTRDLDVMRYDGGTSLTLGSRGFLRHDVGHFCNLFSRPASNLLRPSAFCDLMHTQPVASIPR